jgi:hypothetical protein
MKMNWKDLTYWSKNEKRIKSQDIVEWFDKDTWREIRALMMSSWQFREHNQTVELRWNKTKFQKTSSLDHEFLMFIFWPRNFLFNSHPTWIDQVSDSLHTEQTEC